MRWTVVNAIGAVAWLLGLIVTKNSNLSSWTILIADDHRVMIGGLVGLTGLTILLWTNLTNAA